METSAADAILCALLRGERPQPHAAQHTAALATRAVVQGIAPLIHRASSKAELHDLAQSLHGNARSQAMWEMRHQHVVSGALEGLARAGLRPVLFKGTSMAYQLYDDAALRPRGDTDILLAPGDRDAAARVLESLGFAPEHAVPSYQTTFTWTQDETHKLDVHWRINNSEVLAHLFSHGELVASGVPLPRLSPQALGASRVHNLLITCMHRATHRTNPYYVGTEAHLDPNRLIWLHDIHLLAESLSPGEWALFEEAARAKGLCRVCNEGLDEAAIRFGTSTPARLHPATPSEAPAIYLAAGKLRQRWMDWRAQGTVARRARYAIDVLFPPRAYMQGAFGSAAPIAYVRRLGRGTTKWLRGRA